MRTILTNASISVLERSVTVRAFTCQHEGLTRAWGGLLGLPGRHFSLWGWQVTNCEGCPFWWLCLGRSRPDHCSWSRVRVQTLLTHCLSLSFSHLIHTYSPFNIWLQNGGGGDGDKCLSKFKTYVFTFMEILGETVTCIWKLIEALFIIVKTTKLEITERPHKQENSL